MNKQQTFEQFLTSHSVQVSVWDFAINLLLAAALAYILHLVYIRCGNSLSNRNSFSKNFLLITMTTMLIITIVKASLALSLGLVGALSIVRFRAAIKEPEELAYLFLAIGIGLGLGADQRAITALAFLMIIAIIWLRKSYGKAEENQNLFLTVYSHNPKKAELNEIVSVLNNYCSTVNLKRFDETAEMLESTFLVEYANMAKLNDSKAELQKLGDSVKVTFLDNKGIMGV